MGISIRARASQLLLVTGQRRGEVGGTEVDMRSVKNVYGRLSNERAKKGKGHLGVPAFEFGKRDVGPITPQDR
jgi:hypothetical protein